MKPDELRSKIRESGKHNRCDLSRLLADPQAFVSSVGALADPFRDDRVQLVAGVEAMGLPLAGAVASELRTGLVMLRKPNKVAWSARSASYRDYKQEQGYLEVVEDAFQSGDRVLIVDDWTETGAQLTAAVDLVESTGATVIGLAVLNADAKARLRFATSRHRLHAVFEYS